MVDKWKVEFQNFSDECMDCDEGVDTKRDLKKHFHNAHAQKQCTCEKCTSNEFSKKEVRKHVYEEYIDKEENFNEMYDGEIKMENTEQQKYLGFILSDKGDNMKNISEMRKRSVWIINNIFDKIKMYF